jgi:sugar lactone lactonase YvrE
VLFASLAAVHPAFSSAKETRALDTPINGPMALAIDNQGHLFVAAVDENTVRRIDLRRKTISTVAGNGKKCCYKDGMKATQVSLDFLRALAVDSSGNLFISEGAQVRKVDTRTGIISTVAGSGKSGDTTDGSPAVSASFQRIDGLAVGPHGNLFLADPTQDKIFKLDVTSGKVSRVAGSGKHGLDGDGGSALEASFRFIEGIAFDHDGNLIIADSENCRIRRVDHETGVINTIAVTGGPKQGCPLQPGIVGFVPTPSDLAVNAAGDVYVLEPAMNVGARLDAKSMTLSIVAGRGQRGFSGDGGPATEAQLSGPSGLAIDSNGDLFIADYGNQRVRRVDARTKVITTIAGNGFPHVVRSEM